MALIVETGAGVSGAESYADVAAIDAYWAARPNNALATVWDGGDTDAKEGAAREATAYLDATYGSLYRGYRKDYDQGLEWPRTDALDETARDLPDLPQQLPNAVCELAARALSAPLAEDVPSGGGDIKRIKEKVGPLETDTEYTAAGQIVGLERYRVVHMMLGPVLKVSLGWEWR